METLLLYMLSAAFTSGLFCRNIAYNYLMEISIFFPVNVIY